MDEDNGDPRPVWTTQRLPEDPGDIHEISPEWHQLLQQEQPAVCNATWICNCSHHALRDQKLQTANQLQQNNKNNMAGVIINNIIKEGNIAKQRAPLNSTIFTKIQESA